MRKKGRHNKPHGGERIRRMERRFCELWAADPDRNGMEAARGAGYQGKNSTLKPVASKLLKRPSVKAYIAELTQEAVAKAAAEHEEAVASIQECLERLTTFSRARLTDYLEDDGDVRFDALREAPKGLVRRYQRRTSTVETEKATITNEQTTLELESALAATVRLIEHHRGVAAPPGMGLEAFMGAMTALPDDTLLQIIGALRAARAIDVTPAPAQLVGE